MESPTIRTRRGSAAVGIFGLGGAVVGVVGAVPPFARGCVVGVAGRGPDVMSPTVPPGRRFERPVIDTMCESCNAAAERRHRARDVQADRPARADGRDLGVVLQRRREEQEPHGEGGDAQPQHARPRRPHPAVGGRGQLGVGMRRELRRGLPVHVVWRCAGVGHQKR